VHRRRRWPWVVAAGFVIVVILAGLAVLRYGPLLDDIRVVRATAQRLEARARELQPSDLDRATLERMRADVAELQGGLDPLHAVLRDPVADVAVSVPLVGPQVKAARSLLDAADSLVDVGDLGLDMVERVVALREANEADPSLSLMRGLTEIVASSTGEVDRMSGLIDAAQAHLGEIPDDAPSQLRDARDLIARPLARYAPLLDQYGDIDDTVLSLMGWGGEARYLVLAQNPAELRPAGGYTGTIGIVTLRDGELVEQRFQNVYDLDLQKDLPFVQPPDDLVDYVLGDPTQLDEEPQSWRLADAAWSPDFPTSARKAAEMYAIEADGAQVDGVIAITTFALDRLLEVVGPVEVPEFGVIVEPGEVTMTLIEATRPGAGPTSPESLRGRKDVLDALARIVMQRLLSLSPERWMAMAEALDDIGAQRMAVAWLADDAAQEQVEQLGWAGAVHQDPGDYVYVVESNVAPTSKYNLAVDRTDSLVVRLDESGDALDSLRLEWQNLAAREGEPYQTLRDASPNGPDGWYGAYVRVLVPNASELVTVSGESAGEISGVERTGSEAGRAVFGNSLLIQPGTSTLSYLWQVPGAAVRTEEGWEYRLVIQRQPGARPFPQSVRIELPQGATVTAASDGVIVDGERVTLATALVEDIVLHVAYELPDVQAADIAPASSTPAAAP
jgi:hypothetical protein